MPPSRRTRSSYGPPCPLGRWSSLVTSYCCFCGRGLERTRGRLTSSVEGWPRGGEFTRSIAIDVALPCLACLESLSEPIVNPFPCFCRDTSVCLMNYKADGTPFWNQFFVAALRDDTGKVRYSSMAQQYGAVAYGMVRYSGAVWYDMKRYRSRVRQRIVKYRTLKIQFGREQYVGHHGQVWCSGTVR